MPFSDSPLIDEFRKTNYEDLPEDNDQAALDKFDKTELLLYDMKHRNLNLGYWIIYIGGKGGTGKSSIMRYLFRKHKDWLFNTKQGQALIQKWVDKGKVRPVLDIDSIIYSDYEFLDRSSKAVPLEIIVKDEDFETVAQIGGRAMKERKLMLLSRIRAEQINFIFIDPIFRDDQISELYTYKLYAYDKNFEAKKNRAILSVQDTDGHWQPFGHIVTDFFEWKEYDEKKEKYMKEIKQMQSPEFKRKQIKKIVDAMVHWKNEKGVTDDIRFYQKNAWAGIIKLRLDLMKLGGQRAGTEIKEIKDMIDAYYPIKKEKK